MESSQISRKFIFIFFVRHAGVQRMLVLPDSLPFFQCNDRSSNPKIAAYNILQHYGLLHPNSYLPENIWERVNLFGFLNVDHLTFVELDSKYGIEQFSLFDRYQILENLRGRTIPGFGAEQYRILFDQISQINFESFNSPILERNGLFTSNTEATPQSLRMHTSGGGAAATSHCTVKCGHDVCLIMEHHENAGHGVIVFPWFMYHDHTSGTTFPVIILVYEKENWNAICEKMNRKDIGCWYANIERGLREEGKLTLQKKLEPTDGQFIRDSLGRTPVWYMHFNQQLVKTKLSRATLNRIIASDNANEHLSNGFKEIEAIGFFRILSCGTLVGLPGNPVVRKNCFSKIVQSLLKDLESVIPKPK